MFIAEVVGNVISTKKDDRLIGYKLLTVRPLESGDSGHRGVYVAADRVGAGFGEKVLIAQGYAARQAAGSQEAPVDCAVIGIIDTMNEA